MGGLSVPSRTYGSAPESRVGNNPQARMITERVYGVFGVDLRGGRLDVGQVQAGNRAVEQLEEQSILLDRQLASAKKAAALVAGMEKGRTQGLKDLKKELEACDKSLADASFTGLSHQKATERLMNATQQKVRLLNTASANNIEADNSSFEQQYRKLTLGHANRLTAIGQAGNANVIDMNTAFRQSQADSKARAQLSASRRTRRRGLLAAIS